MKLKSFILMAAIALCSAACSDDENEATVADIAGRYEGYTLASCAYFQGTCTDGESITVSANADGTAQIAFTSETWGTFNIPNAQMTESGGTYTLAGSGETQMGHAGQISTYDCSFTATIRGKEDAGMTFSVPSVMGGLSIDFHTGAAPAEAE